MLLYTFTTPYRKEENKLLFFYNYDNNWLLCRFRFYFEWQINHKITKILYDALCMNVNTKQ